MREAQIDIKIQKKTKKNGTESEGGGASSLIWGVRGLYKNITASRPGVGPSV